jgi:AraC-like DNA-binding protein
MSHAINNVLAHISANLGDELREPMLAELVGQSPSAFSRSFRKHTGQSFVRYVNRLRISRACELLTNSEKPVLDVCMDVGFNNVSNFNRQFLCTSACRRPSSATSIACRPRPRVPPARRSRRSFFVPRVVTGAAHRAPRGATPLSAFFVSSQTTPRRPQP